MNTHSFLYEKGGYKQPNSHFTSMFQFVPVYFSTFVLNFQADFFYLIMNLTVLKGNRALKR